MKNPRYLFLIVALIVCVGASHHVQAQTQFCPRELLHGYEAEYVRAHTVLPDRTTPRVDDMSVFVTVHGESLYVQSNYAPPGLAQPRASSFGGGLTPFKLATDESISELSEVINILTDPRYYLMPEFRTERDFEAKRQAHEQEIQAAYARGMTIYVEERLFNSSKWRELDLGFASDVRLVTSKFIYKTILRPHALAMVGEKPKRLVALHSNHVFTDIRNTAVVTRFNNTAFRRNDVRVLPLLQDQATLERFKLLIPSALQIDTNHLTSEAVINSFARNQGKILFIIGHIPERTGRLVVEDAAQGEVFSISIKDLEDAAKANHNRLFIMGCKSVTEGAGQGTLEVLNSVNAVDRIYSALGAKTYGDFLRRISDTGSKLNIVVDEVLIEGAERRISISFHHDVIDLALGFGLASGTVIVYEVFSTDDDRRRRVKKTARTSIRRTANGSRGKHRN